MKLNIKHPVLKSLWAVGVISIVILSVLPAGNLPVMNVSDKIEHFLAYAVIALLGFFATSTNKRRFILAAAMVVMGIALEGVQYLLPTRAFELWDAVANTLGVLTAIAAYSIYDRWKMNIGG